MIKRSRGWWWLVVALMMPAFACTLTQSDGPPRNAVQIDILANTSLTAWLADSVADFNAAGIENADGDPIYINLLPATEAGQAVVDLRDGQVNPTLWIPDDKVWANILADQGGGAFQSDCVSVAQSPLVIALWRPLAEALGWPGRDLGWLDIGSLAADSSAWAYYSGGQYGATLRLGHTHPGLSATGASTLLALVQAAQSKTEAVSPQDIQQPIVQASVGAFEGGVSWFSSDTDSLGRTMAERGPTFLGAGIMYESTVLQYGRSTEPDGLVPVYPFEGTFVAAHPACVNENAGTQQQEAARLFRDYLTGADGQTRAVAHGLRPVNNTVPAAAPLDAAHGVDLAQPQTVFGAPGIDAVYSIQEIWQAARKDVNMVMLLDVSGSMRGSKMENMRQAAIQFVQQMGDEDYLTLIAFSDALNVVVDHEQVGTFREAIVAQIQGLEARGDTALYDAIGLGAERIAETTTPQTTNALVVLTDGLDTYSYRYSFDERLIDAAAANGTTVFTIAYGSDADETLLQELAQRTFGNFYLGNEASIAGIYEEMSAAFGGSLGVGR